MKPSEILSQFPLTPGIFVARFDCLTPRQLARGLGFTGRNAVKRAQYVRALARNVDVAMHCDRGADSLTGASYWAIATRVHDRMPARDVALLSLPVRF